MEILQKTILVKETLSELLKSMDFPVRKIIVFEDEFGVLRANIECDNAPLLIGYHGQTLAACQTILKSVLWRKGFDEKGSIVLDVNEYKKSQEQRMISVAIEKAESVRATNIPQFMPIMSPYMRRLIHLHFTKEDYADLETESVGEEGKRRIQIKKKGNASLSLE